MAENIENIENIRQKIVEMRTKQIASAGHTLGVQVPEERSVPLVPFRPSPVFICEVKRRSPSKGAIAPQLDGAKTARKYRALGANAISVLTEETFFGGSLADLLAVKLAVPECTVLRKDFLLDAEDIAVSYRAGADAVLLIAGMLTEERLKELYRLTRSYGMDPLVELHSREDIRKAEAIRPEITGINARDLKTFNVDLIYPLRMRNTITWPTRCIFESGIRSGEDAAFAVSSGFDGVLVGESVVKDPALVTEIKEKITRFYTHRENTGKKDFWSRLYGRNGSSQDHSARPLIKICGITRREDLLYTDELGADMAGFILADSPRRVSAEFIAGLPETRALKVGVYVGAPRTSGTSGPSEASAGPQLPPKIRPPLGTRLQALLDTGKLDCIQFHGEEEPEDCFQAAFPYYKAVRVQNRESLAALNTYRSPRVLIDAFSASARGGTGKRIDSKLVTEAAAVRPLWLAGGINPQNAGEIVSRFHPELIDVSSGVEDSPGVKNHHKMKQLFEEAAYAYAQG